jgi:hypothetical protein
MLSVSKIAGFLALGCGPALATGEAPRVRVEPVPAIANEKNLDTPHAGTTPGEAFHTALARAKERCTLSVHEDDSTSFEAGTDNTWCFDDTYRIQLFEQSFSVEGNSTDTVFVVEDNALRCAWESDDNHGHSAERVYCEGAGGEVTDFDTHEPRAMTSKERSELLGQVPSLLGRLEIPEQDSDGDCSATPEFEEQCYGDGMCFKPSHTIIVSTELCEKADALRDSIDAVVIPD